MTAAVLARRTSKGTRFTLCERIAALEAAHDRFLRSGIVTTGPRYPLAELYRIIGPASLAEVAEAAGIHPRQLSAMHAQGCVTELQADRLAAAFGHHPCLVWPEWFA